MTPDDTLPALTTEVDPPGATTEALIGPAGGRIASPDGRVVIDVPGGAFAEELRVVVTRRVPQEFTRPAPDFEFVGVWQFDALDHDTGAAVHRFGKDLTFTFRFSGTDLFGLEPGNLAFWTLNEATNDWEPIAAGVDAEKRTLVARADHFSIDAVTATSIMSLGPLMDGRLVDLHSGTSSLSIPLAVPPGQGGLVPDLTLTYNSGRLYDMLGFASVPSWVGLGWDLDVPNIQISPNPGYSPGDSFTHRVFLSIGGFGGEIMQDPEQDQHPDGGHIWRARTDPYLKIRGCGSTSCPQWTVWDRNGLKYTFGVADFDQYHRWFRGKWGTGTASWTYRVDVTSIEDTLGNRIEFEYDQIKFNDPDPTVGGEYVMSSYPSRIKYNFNDAGVAQAEIIFTVAAEQCGLTIAKVTNVCARRDTPRDVAPGACSQWYRAPRTLETRKLTQVEIKVGGATVRRYDFDYDNTDFAVAPGKCPYEPHAGELTLKTVTMRDRALAAYTFTTTSFFYRDDLPHRYYNDNGTVKHEYSRPHLQRVENGFGGKVHFAYQEKVQVSGHPYWSRRVVSQQRHEFGAGQPDVVTDISYAGTPQYYPRPNPLFPSTVDWFEAAYRGFSEVTETTGGVQTIHKFFTTGDQNGNPWNDEVLTGREYETSVKDALGSTWQRTTHTWHVRPVDNLWSSGRYFVNFAFLSGTSTFLRDGTQLRTEYRYDDRGYGDVSQCAPLTCFGLMTEEHDLGETPGIGERVITKRKYHKDTAKWLFPLQYEEIIDDGQGGIFMGCRRYYYDGATANGAALTRGLLTAVSEAIEGTSAQCTGGLPFTQSRNTYTVYELNAAGTRSYGNVKYSSVATFIDPEGETPAGNVAFGWIPLDPATQQPVPSTHTLYDTIHHVFPIQATNAAGHTTTTVWDFILGKPTQITSPNGNVTTVVYDNLGRVDRWYDSLDSHSYPTERYIYNWGTAPNMTRTITRTSHGAASEASAVTCTDGFGRVYAEKAQYQGSLYSESQTRFNERGLPETVTAPFHVGTIHGCMALVDVTLVDRTVTAFDPLGNAMSSMNVAANRSTGPASHTLYSGKTTVYIDGNENRTEHVRDFVGRSLTVYEPGAGTSTAVVRPTGPGNYSHWPTVIPNQLHYLSVGETTADDDGSYIGGTASALRDSFAFNAASLPDGAKVNVVRLHFRWKHVGAASTAVAFSAFFRESSTDVSGPAYRLSEANGWQNEIWEMPVNPRTGNLWTEAEIEDGLEFGFKLESSAAAPRITQAWVEVETAPMTIGTSTYRFDALGRLSSFTDPAGIQTVVLYDLLGQKRTLADPNVGNWSYTYNAGGSLKTQTDARGITTTLTYDPLERLTGKSYSNGDTSVSFLYDSYPDTTFCNGAGAHAIGQLVRMTDAAGQEFRCYDIRGRATKTRRTISGSGTYDFARTFDPLGRVETLTFPDGETIQYGRLAQGGHLTSLSIAGGQNLVSNVSRKPSHQLGLVSKANGLFATSYSYDFQQRLTGIVTGSMQDLELTYDDASNVVAVDDAGASPETLMYTYDQLHRVTQFWVNGAYAAGYIYQSNGNMYAKYEGHPTFGLTYADYWAGTRCGENGAVGPRNGVCYTHNFFGTTYRSFQYDANGNMTWAKDWTTGIENTYTYDAENRLKTRTLDGGGSFTYRYSGTGGLLKRDKSDGTWTAYAGDGYEVTNTGQVTKYYSIEGQTVAMQQAGTVYYILRDHLGSATQFVTAGGQVHSGQKYYPFGATRSTSGTPPTDKLYTGQQKEEGDSLGLYHYGARAYSTVLAHFLSADPVVASAYDPQSWHAYSYVHNNPLRFVDPTGMYIDRPGDAAPARCDSACQARHDAKQRARDHELLVGALKYLAEKAHQELVGALQYLAYQNEIRSWTESQSIAAGGAGDCGTACQWKAAARAFELAAAAVPVNTQRPSEIFGIPIPCCAIAAVGLQASGTVAGHTGAVQAEVVSDSSDATEIMGGAQGGGATLPLEGSLGYEGKIGWVDGGIDQYSGFSGSSGVCVGAVLTLCGGAGFTRGGGWFEYSYQVGFGPKNLRVPVSFYGTGGVSEALDKITPW